MVTLSVLTLSVHATTGPRKHLFAKHMFGGMPRLVGVWMYVMLSLYMWFCDHCEWWGVWVVGHRLLPSLEHGLTFGVVGDIHIRVCMSNPVN